MSIRWSTFALVVSGLVVGCTLISGVADLRTGETGDSAAHGGGGNGGQGGPSSSGTGGASSSGTGGATSSGTGGATSSGTGGATSSGTGGSVTSCAHDPCEIGVGLDPSCDPCVQQVCQNDSFCCNNEWDYWCVNQVLSVCGQDCGAGLPDCSSQYGGGSDYLFDCSQSPATCEFGYNDTSMSCAQYCLLHGGECFSVYNDNGQCGYTEQLSCDHTGFQSVLCICSHGCGAQPPCNTPIEHCVDGSCQ